MCRHVLMVLVAVVLAGCGQEEQGASNAARSSEAAASEVSIPAGDEASAAPIDVQIELDNERAVRRVLNAEGGTLETTAADGTKLTLTIPPKALLGPEEITLTPVRSMTLPDGVTLNAAAQLSPSGLLLLEPATLDLQLAKPVSAEEEIPLAWSGNGEDLHAYTLMPSKSGTVFQLTHFSGVGMGSGSASAADPLIKGVGRPCSGQYFRKVTLMVRKARQEALMGNEPDMAPIANEWIKTSKEYVKKVLTPVLKAAETDDSLLPCATSEFIAWQRQGQLFLSDGFDTQFAEQVQTLTASLMKGVVNAFNKANSRCKAGESPIFQVQKMISAARYLQMVGQQALLPDDANEKIVDCGRSFDFKVDVESEISNVYNKQGQGAGVSSSKTKIEARGMIAKLDEERSKTSPVAIFTAKRMPADATASIVSRTGCPDQVKVQPGSTLGVTVEPIINVRVGKLRCAGGKAKCEGTDTNPGVLMTLAPHVIESTYMHTKTADKCDPMGYWNEFMMYHTGATSVDSSQPFQVRGEQESVTATRSGGPMRKQYIDIPPTILAMQPGMKDYIEIRTPAIQTATERTKVSLSVQRH